MVLIVMRQRRAGWDGDGVARETSQRASSEGGKDGVGTEEEEGVLDESWADRRVCVCVCGGR